MFVDARTLRDGSLIESDVCIIGAGAAGITIARELRGRPLRVAVLESGWLKSDAITQSLYAGTVSQQAYFSLASARNRHFGGSTNQWAGECRPLEPQDFEARDWVPDSGWPFAFEHLLPFYERAQSLCQLGPFAYAASDWRPHGVRPLPFHGERVLTHVLHYSPPTRFGRVYRDELKRAANVVTYLGANVVELETPAPPDRVGAARVACLSGTGFRIAARLFILATGGIENARLLLLANRAQPAGLGNGSDLVGRYFMEHLYLDAAASIRARGEGIDGFYTAGHRSEGRRVRGILGLDPELCRRERLTNFSAVLDEATWGSAAALWRSLASDLKRRRLGTGTPARLRSLLGHFALGVAARSRSFGGGPRVRYYLLKNVMEQAPNRESRVVLGQDRDRLGSPRVELRWRLSEIDKRTAHRAHEILREAMAPGIGDFRSMLGQPEDPWPPGLRGARHHMGTTRMHSDPRRGVVDADGRVHGIANLYVAGSSVFPTSGTANPTLTIVALALRLAGHVERVLA
jgi:choline dehydrogenase-like flavoprotein